MTLKTQSCRFVSRLRTIGSADGKMFIERYKACQAAVGPERPQ